MDYQHLKNFISQRIRQNDIFVPAMILFLVRNEGWGTKEQIARLIYIFDYKHDLAYYETIVEKFSGVLLEEYSIVRYEEDVYTLRAWPLNDTQINDIVRRCSRLANGFFSTTSATKALTKEKENH
jgi:hypothetical protein